MTVFNESLKAGDGERKKTNLIFPCGVTVVITDSRSPLYFRRKLENQLKSLEQLRTTEIQLFGIKKKNSPIIANSKFFYLFFLSAFKTRSTNKYIAIFTNTKTITRKSITIQILFFTLSVSLFWSYLTSLQNIINFFRHSSSIEYEYSTPIRRRYSFLILPSNGMSGCVIKCSVEFR